jgi:hypothetical protein
MVAMAHAARLIRFDRAEEVMLCRGGYIVWDRVDCCRWPARCNLVYVVN